MARAFVYGAIVLLALFVLAAALVVEKGGGSSQAALAVSVHDLSAAPDAHDGDLVTTSGTLRFALEPEAQLLLTEDGLGIVVRGYDEIAMRALDGLQATVTGRFGIDERDGVYITPDSISEIR
jgi:hypothetical protein